MVAAAFRTIFAYTTREEIAEQYDKVADTFRERFAKAAELMDEAKEELLAFSPFPRAHWRQIWSTNPLERLNKELKKRCRVVGIFPNEAAVTRLAGSVLLDIHDEWQAAERRYFSEGSMADFAASTRINDTSVPSSRREGLIVTGDQLKSPPLGGTLT